MKFKQLAPVDVVLGKYGQWSHPDLVEYIHENIDDNAEYITNEQWSELKKHFNIETVTFWLSSCVSSDDFEQIMDDCDLSKWNISEPNGFFLIDIGFTEEDAQAIFAREIRKESEVH